jgi:hypothetical protein
MEQCLNSSKYICTSCNFKTNIKHNWTAHLATSKHKRNTIHGGKYICKCGKSYNHSSALSRHKKTCDSSINVLSFIEQKYHQNNFETHDGLIVTTLKTLFKQNQEFMKSLVPSVINNGHINVTNNSQINNQFNLNVFLNEHCKNAMSINDFVKSIDLNVNHLEKVLQNGLTHTLGDVVSNALQELDETMRPIHCTDLKRQIFFVNMFDETIHQCGPVWEKDEDTKIIFSTFKAISNLMIGLLDQWQRKNPGFQCDDNVSVVYLKLVKSLMVLLEDYKIKLIKNIAPYCAIDKKKYLT